MKAKPYFNTKTGKIHVGDYFIICCDDCKDSDNLMMVKFDGKIVVSCVNCEKDLIIHECEEYSEKLEII